MSEWPIMCHSGVVNSRLGEKSQFGEKDMARKSRSACHEHSRSPHQRRHPLPSERPPFVASEFGEIEKEVMDGCEDKDKY